MIEPLRFQFEVACDARHAFATWTARASSWWPRTHTVGQQDVVSIVFEPRVGGRIFERTRDGSEHEWGEITAWEPPSRLAYLWRIATDRAGATDVEIRFVELPTHATRIEIEHTGWDRLGVEQGGAWRSQNRVGWYGVLPVFVTECAATSELSPERR